MGASRYRPFLPADVRRLVASFEATWTPEGLTGEFRSVKESPRSTPGTLGPGIRDRYVATLRSICAKTEGGGTRSFNWIRIETTQLAGDSIGLAVRESSQGSLSLEQLARVAASALVSLELQ